MKRVLSLFFVFFMCLNVSNCCFAIKRVFTEGACCSDDIKYYIKDTDKIVHCGRSRCSNIISLVSKKPENIDTSLISKDEKKYWGVRYLLKDINKTFFLDLKKANPDILLIDFTDERWDIFKIGDAYICDCGDGTGFTKKLRNDILKKAQVLKEEDRFDLWKKSFDIFVKRVNETIGNGKIYVNKIYNAYTYKNKYGQCFKFNSPPAADKSYVKGKNALLNKYYNYVKKNYPDIKFLRYDKKFFVGNENHRWGNWVLHYTDDFYLETIKKLNQVS